MSGSGFTFGAQNPTGTGFGFGQAQTITTNANKGFLSTPATTSTGSGFSFGTLGAPAATVAATPGGFSFGSTPAAAPLTSQTTTTPALGSYSFGATPTATSASGGGFSFGTPATAPLAGQTTTTPALGGFSYGTSAVAPATSGGSYSFGGTTTTGTTTSTGFSLGGGTLTVAAPVSSTGTGFSFGAVPTATTPASTSGFAVPASTSGFAVPASTSGFAAPAATSGFSTPASTPGFSFGGLGGTTPASQSTGFSFGNTTQTTAAKPSGFGFGVTSATQQTTAAPLANSGALGGVGTGLGGAQPPSANAGTNSTGAKTDGKSAKKQQMPPDLFSTIAVFETWRNAENCASEENIRLKADPFHKVGKKAEEIQKSLAELASDYLQLHASAVNLKAEVMKEAEHVEMARRTKDTPMALQGENKSPEVYFINLVRSFEAQMIYCRNKIDEVSLCMQAANNPCETPDDVAEVLQREHEALKELASKVYAKHAQLVELSHRLNTKTVPNEQAFFREQSKKSAETPASAVVRPALGGSSSGLHAFQEQQQRAKAVTFGAAPPTMPLAQTSTPSLFGSSSGSSIFNGSSFGSSAFNMGTTTGNSSFGNKSLFGNSSSTLGGGLGFMQPTTSPFSMNSSFTPKPFEEDPDGRRKRRL
ncbi:nuclear pore complex protein Nup58-like isoform X2 [Palaemon carinicauda]|uniref:nuclear pore complex protein Nup58-like isoform X2 n=1 Tax=Palaemon carinicauda TaxID=392227 RepID=UPI0035B5767F